MDIDFVIGDFFPKCISVDAKDARSIALVPIGLFENDVYERFVDKLHNHFMQMPILHRLYFWKMLFQLFFQIIIDSHHILYETLNPSDEM